VYPPRILLLLGRATSSAVTGPVIAFAVQTGVELGLGDGATEAIGASSLARVFGIGCEAPASSEGEVSGRTVCLASQYKLTDSTNGLCRKSSGRERKALLLFTGHLR
jgi:hypothetical protein